MMELPVPISSVMAPVMCAYRKGRWACPTMALLMSLLRKNMTREQPVG